MSVKAKAIYTLYRTKRVNNEGVRKAVADRIITADDYKMITGEAYE